MRIAEVVLDQGGLPALLAAATHVGSRCCSAARPRRSPVSPRAPTPSRSPTVARYARSARRSSSKMPRASRPRSQPSWRSRGRSPPTSRRNGRRPGRARRRGDGGLRLRQREHEQGLWARLCDEGGKAAARVISMARVHDGALAARRWRHSSWRTSVPEQLQADNPDCAITDPKLVATRNIRSGWKGTARVGGARVGGRPLLTRLKSQTPQISRRVHHVAGRSDGSNDRAGVPGCRARRRGSAHETRATADRNSVVGDGPMPPAPDAPPIFHSAIAAEARGQRVHLRRWCVDAEDWEGRSDACDARQVRRTLTPATTPRARTGSRRPSPPLCPLVSFHPHPLAPLQCAEQHQRQNEGACEGEQAGGGSKDQLLSAMLRPGEGVCGEMQRRPSVGVKRYLPRAALVSRLLRRAPLLRGCGRGRFDRGRVVNGDRCTVT